ncbi:MAG: radical SAM protein [Thermoplasmatota archaeon]
MQYNIIECDSLLRTITKKDTLFSGNYCIDPYQYCEFGCKYCDSSFEKKIFVKKNSEKILDKELQTKQKGTIIIGSVHDPYQPAEQTYEMTKKILKVIKKHNFPCHILTKSILIQRDINLISSMNCTVTISILSLNKKISQLFEHKVSSTQNRLEIVKTLVEHNIITGVALIPIMPYINDGEIQQIIKEIKNKKPYYILHKYLELKGEQKQIFFSLLQQQYPDLLSTYTIIYNNTIRPKKEYIKTIDNQIHQYCKKCNISQKIQ